MLTENNCELWTEVVAVWVFIILTIQSVAISQLQKIVNIGCGKNRENPQKCVFLHKR
jgi:hypothetical protein